MRKWHVVVGNVMEELNLVLSEHGCSCNRVHRCIAPSFIEEAAVLVEGLEVVHILLRSQPFQAADLKV